MSTKVSPEQGELEYSPSMYEGITNMTPGRDNVVEEEEEEEEGGKQNTPNQQSKGRTQQALIIPASYTSHADVQFLSPACCGWSCQRRLQLEQNLYIGIDSFSFDFYDNNGRPMPGLQQSFQNKFAQQHKVAFRTSCYGGVLAMILFAVWDWHYYLHDVNMLTTLMILRFAGLVPCLLLAGSLTHTQLYWDHQKRYVILAILSGGLGVLIIAYSFITRGANQGTFALFFALLFFLTPLPFGTALGLGSSLWLVYLPCLLVAGQEGQMESAVDLLMDWDVIQSWSNLLASLILYGALRYVQVQNFAADIVKLAFLARNRDAAHKEREHASQLLLSCLPEEIIGQLEDNLDSSSISSSSSSFARHHDSVTVLFCQVCNISAVSNLFDEALGHQDGPKAVVSYLSPIFTCFDQIMDQCSCYKVETVMDVYMAVAGAPTEVTNHADLIAHCACLMIASKPTIRLNIEKSLRKLCNSSPLKSAQWKIDALVQAVGEKFDIHIGINSGPINAGVCGNLTPRYKLFGDTVNTASRMESTAPYGKIQASPAAAALISDDLFVLDKQPPIPVKGKGEIAPFYLSPKAKNILTIKSPIPQQLYTTTGNSNNGGTDDTETSEDTRDASHASSSKAKLRKHKSNRGSVLRKSVLVAADGHDNDHFRDYVEEWTSAHSTSAPPSLIPPKLTSTQYMWMGIWGLPYYPCGSPQIPPVVLAYHKEQEERFESAKSPSQMRTLRFLSYLTLFATASLCWLDFDRYADYTQAPGGVCYRLNNEASCIDSEHISYHKDWLDDGLCSWDQVQERCIRNITVLSDAEALGDSGCQWVYDIPISAWFRGRAERQLVYSLVARFGGLGFLSVLLVGLTLVPWFKRRPFGFCQAWIGGFITMMMGAVLICMTWISGEPGQGMLICWIFLAMYASNIRFLPRLCVLICMSIMYAPIMYYYNPYKSTVRLCTDPIQYIGTRMFFVLFSTLSTALPIGKREIWLRKQHARNEAMTHSETLLNQLHLKTHNLMSKLLPKHVVTQLSSQQRHERQAIAEFFSEVSIVFTDMVSISLFFPPSSSISRCV
jgi:class 3 adenylate cyclase